MNRIIAGMLLLALTAPSAAAAQAPPDVWRSFLEQVDVGTELNVRLRDGTRFRATFLGTRDDAALLQPRTRVTVPVQPVPFDAIASLERRQEGGIGAGKAAAIGVASGVGTFFAILAIVLGAFGD